MKIHATVSNIDLAVEFLLYGSKVHSALSKIGKKKNNCNSINDLGIIPIHIMLANF